MRLIPYMYEKEYPDSKTSRCDCRDLGGGTSYCKCVRSGLRIQGKLYDHWRQRERGSATIRL